jgi:AbrB family looped-hinge helix DNA binding protein
MPLYWGVWIPCFCQTIHCTPKPLQFFCECHKTHPNFLVISCQVHEHRNANLWQPQTSRIGFDLYFTCQYSFTFFGLLNELCLHSLQIRESKVIKNTKKEILGTTTMSHKFQITIPKKVRAKHGLKEGDTIVFVDENDKLYITKSTEI